MKNYKNIKSCENKILDERPTIGQLSISSL